MACVLVTIQTVFPKAKLIPQPFLDRKSLLNSVQRATVGQGLLSAAAMYNTACSIVWPSKLSLGSCVLIQNPEGTLLPTALVKSHNKILGSSLVTDELEELHQYN